MLKVVLDANLFVSGIITAKGNPARILNLIRDDKLRLLISPAILEEVRKVLLYPHIRKLHGFGPEQVDENLGKLTAFAEFIPGVMRIEIVKDDPTDDKYVECAAEGGADYIISGDRHLTDLKHYQGIKIVGPTSFLTLFRPE